MNPKVRQSCIVDLLRDHGEATVEALAERFEISQETIRRDLNALAAIGRVQKIHGRARLPRAHVEGSFELRMKENAPGKATIARRAAALISPGETLFIDTGSTTLMFASALAGISDLTVITNSTRIAQVVSRAGDDSGVYLLGGRFETDNQETQGPTAIAQLEAYRAHWAIITVGGIDPVAGASDYNIEEAQVAGAMIKQAQRLVVLADESKFDRVGSFGVCPLVKIDYLVSDAPPTGELSRMLTGAGVSIVC